MVAMSSARPEKKSLPKRFYAAVDVVQQGAAFLIALDGKTIKTPARKLLQLEAQQLAEKIAEEWRAQAQVIDTDTMPLTRLANIALDRVESDRAALLLEINAYAETDLLCYRSPDAVLRARQAQHFDLILHWLAQEYAAPFVTTEGLLPIPQHASSLATIAAQFAAASDHELAALAMLVPILGSALLTLAVWRGKWAVDEALIAARLDEDYQAEKWAMDEEQIRHWQHKCRDARASAFFLMPNRLS